VALLFIVVVVHSHQLVFLGPLLLFQHEVVRQLALLQELFQLRHHLLVLVLEFLQEEVRNLLLLLFQLAHLLQIVVEVSL
jgi:hypothetical protein